MEDKNSPSFKFNVDNEIPDLLFQNKRKNRRMEKTSAQKGILLPVFLFLLTGVLLFAAYFDTRTRISKIQDKEQTLSQDMEAKINALSSQFAAIEKSLTEKVFPMDQSFSTLEATIASLKDGLKKAEQNIEKFTASQPDKKTLENTISEIEKNLTPLREALTNVETAVKSLDEKFTNELRAISETLDQTKEEFHKFKTENSDSPGSGINKEAFDLAFENQQKLYQKKIDLIIENLSDKEDKIDDIRAKLDEIEEDLKSFKEKPVPSKPPVSKTKPETVKKPAKEPVIHPIDEIKPKPGTFIERNIE